MPQSSTADRRTSRAMAQAVTETLVQMTTNHRILAARRSAARLAELKAKLTDYLRTIRSTEPASAKSTHRRREEIVRIRQEDLERLSRAGRRQKPPDRGHHAARVGHAAIG